MITVISHFYNEEYLLPFWLKHHTMLFDHGVLVNYASTDSSVDIIKSLAPAWEIVDSRNTHFHRKDIDDEIVDIERNIPGWKITLNTTEFLYHYDLRGYLNYTDDSIEGIWLPPIVPVDISFNSYLDHATNITTQFYYGTIGKNPLRPTNRLIHKTRFAGYTEGRHSAQLKKVVVAHDIFHCWLSYAPWNEEMISRKLQIQDKMSENFKKSGVGGMHVTNRKELFRRYLIANAASYSLATHPIYSRIYHEINSRYRT